MSITIGLVARCLNTPHMRGMGKYVFELLKSSVSRTDVSWRLFGDDIRYPLSIPEAVDARTDVFAFRGDRFELWEQIGLPLRASNSGVDLLHCTEGSLPFLQPTPTVITLHDTLAWEERADTFGAWFYWEKLVPSALKKCAAIITISESSRCDILNRWPWLETKLSVIPHGIDAAYFSEDECSLSVQLDSFISCDPYLVYMGGALERKRFNWAVEVLARAGCQELKMVACGFDTAARQRMFASLPNELSGRIFFAPYLSENELRTLYRRAQALLYPTLYEGFGFPAIEAQASGLPAIFSSLGSLSELRGPLAMIVSPFDIDEWVAAVDRALHLGDRRVDMSIAAADWARRFEWRRSFEDHFSVYKSVLVSYE